LFGTVTQNRFFLFLFLENYLSPCSPTTYWSAHLENIFQEIGAYIKYILEGVLFCVVLPHFVLYILSSWTKGLQLAWEQAVELGACVWVQPLPGCECGRLASSVVTLGQIQAFQVHIHKTLHILCSSAPYLGSDS
jgi:hypothetical protein